MREINENVEMIQVTELEDKHIKTGLCAACSRGQRKAWGC